jgi:hypothetical protein
MLKKIRGVGVAALIFSCLYFFWVNPRPWEGSDIMARMMASIIKKEKMLPVSVTAVNRPGAGRIQRRGQRLYSRENMLTRDYPDL